MSQYTTGEIAKLCGVSVRTVQYYDSRNILTPTALSEGGRRLYSEQDLQKLRRPAAAVTAARKAMLSQPMAGKSDEEIVAAREKAVAALTEKGYTVINTLFTDEWYSKEAMQSRGVEQIPLCFLAKSLENMSLCHAAYFCKGWESARGCRIEHEAAKAYGLTIIYEEDEANA